MRKNNTSRHDRIVLILVPRPFLKTAVKVKQLLPLRDSSGAYPQCPRNCLQSSTGNPRFKINNNGSIKKLPLSKTSALLFRAKTTILKLTFIPFSLSSHSKSICNLLLLTFYLSFYLSLSLTPTDISLLNIAWIHRDKIEDAFFAIVKCVLTFHEPLVTL